MGPYITVQSKKKNKRWNEKTFPFRRSVFKFIDLIWKKSKTFSLRKGWVKNLHECTIPPFSQCFLQKPKQQTNICHSLLVFDGFLISTETFLMNKFIYEIFTKSVLWWLRKSSSHPLLWLNTQNFSCIWRSI